MEDEEGDEKLMEEIEGLKLNEKELQETSADHVSSHPKGIFSAEEIKMRLKVGQ